MKKVSAIIIGMMLSSAACANAAFSSEINLHVQAHIAPLQSLVISYANVREHVSYNVICAMNSDHKDQEQDDTYIKLYATGVSLGYSIDDYLLGGSHQGKITAGKGHWNYVKISGLVKNQNPENTIIVQNLDDTDTIEIADCYATPIG